MRRNIFGSLAILVVVGALSLGLPAIDRLLPAARAVVAGQPITIGHGVTIVPPPGAALDVTRTSPAKAQVLLTIGGIQLRVQASECDDTLDELAERLRRRITHERGYQVSAHEQPARTGSGVPGIRGSFSSAGRDGFYVVFLADGIGVEVDARGSVMELRRGFRRIETAVDSIRFEVAR